MIHNDIQNQLALLVKTSAPPLIEVAQSPAETPQWTPGQRVPAFVIASLPNGRFQVQVEEQILDMNLPRNAEPGQKLELTYLTSSPRLTFAMSQDMERALPSNSGVSLSETAKFLGALLQRGNTENGGTSALARSAVVLPGAPAAMQDFAAALRAAVSQSGLFYESHQAQWVTGERSLTALLQEPQARLPGANDPLQKSQADGQPGLAPSFPKGGVLADAVGNLPLMQGLGQHDSSTGANLPRDLVHPQAAPLVHQQLETLDTRQIVWQGQVWPGQEMDWRIEEDESRHATADEDESQWRTRLHLVLPGLGGVTARLAIAASGVRIEMVAERGDSAALLRGDASRLAVSMEASGLKVAGLTVREDGRT
ncbi:MAG TPA: flagellar hook-length control protein FliK [Novimethylophilus sp.]|jgi:hypothetical protein|uniref:flagellar hook-length control protein FliK n=1 Tax=Novimethylophilus sp. TaxID=2137426 RepID=UPI002F40239B